jgi:hypothetical protein
MKKIGEEILIEIRNCEAEIRRAHDEIIRLTERQRLFEDRKTMLSFFVEILRNSEDNKHE